jgi:hypothetical protein
MILVLSVVSPAGNASITVPPGYVFVLRQATGIYTTGTSTAQRTIWLTDSTTAVSLVVLFRGSTASIGSSFSYVGNNALGPTYPVEDLSGTRFYPGESIGVNVASQSGDSWQFTLMLEVLPA